MNKFSNENLINIKSVFEEKTGVNLTKKSGFRRPVRTALIMTALLICFTATAVGTSIFSSLEEDELSFKSAYLGNGIVSIEVENSSEKDLVFQEKLMLMQWNDSQMVKSTGEKVIFSGTSIPAGQTGTMIVNLSLAYNMEELEKPIYDDNYYFILTNNNFLFGQDWICSVDFCDSDDLPGETTKVVDESLGRLDSSKLSSIPKELQFYFEKSYFDIHARANMAYEYSMAVEDYLADFDGNIVAPVTPNLVFDTMAEGVVFDDSIPQGRNHWLSSLSYHSVDAYFRMIGRTPAEEALVFSVLLPQEYRVDTGDGGSSVPLLYFVTYEKSAVQNPDNYAFIYGRTLSFDELEVLKVYDDEEYVCYEVSPLIYDDMMEYASDYIEGTDQNIRWDSQSKKRLQNLYNYFTNNLEFYYLEFE